MSTMNSAHYGSAVRQSPWSFWSRVRAVFAWLEVRSTGVWAYEENDITGRRRAIRVGAGHQPVDGDWLERRK